MRGLLLILFLCAQAAIGQTQSSDMLAAARNAANDLRYGEADSLARTILQRGDAVPREQRIAALQVAAYARFPEEKEEQHRDSAIAALRQLAQLGESAPLPHNYSWPGLDSLWTGLPGPSRAPAVATAPERIASATAGDPSPAASATRDAVIAWLNGHVPPPAMLGWRVANARRVFVYSERKSALKVAACRLEFRHELDEYTNLPSVASAPAPNRPAARAIRNRRAAEQRSQARINFDSVRTIDLALFDATRLDADTARAIWAPWGVDSARRAAAPIRSYVRLYRRGPLGGSRAAGAMPDARGRVTFWFDAPLPAAQRFREGLQRLARTCAGGARQVPS